MFAEELGLCWRVGHVGEQDEREEDGCNTEEDEDCLEEEMSSLARESQEVVLVESVPDRV